VAWCHLHPHFFMDNLLTTLPVIDGQIHWYTGEKRTGWIAVR